MGYNPPLPPPPPPKRIIREDAPVFFKPKKKLVDVRDETGRIRTDIKIDMDGYPVVTHTNLETNERTSVKYKNPDLIDVKDLYSPHLPPSYSSKKESEKLRSLYRVQKLDYNAKWLAKINISQNEKQKQKFPPNLLTNESTGEVTYQYVDDRVIADQAQADHHAEWYDIFPDTPKKKSRWERLVDRIILNIVWGK